VNRSTTGVNSLPMTVNRQRRDCDLNPGPSVPESSILTMHSANEPPLYRMGYDNDEDSRVGQSAYSFGGIVSQRKAALYYPRDAMLARVLAMTLSVCLSVCLSVSVCYKSVFYQKE